MKGILGRISGKHRDFFDIGLVQSVHDADDESEFGFGIGIDDDAAFSGFGAVAHSAFNLIEAWLPLRFVGCIGMC